MNPFQKFLSGISTLVVCMVFVLACHALGFELDKMIENGLLIGAAAGAGIGIWGAKQMPSGTEPKP